MDTPLIRLGYQPFLQRRKLTATATQRRSVWRSAKATSSSRLTHVDASGRPSMVDISSKTSTQRTATARGTIFIPKVAYDLVVSTGVHHSSDDGVFEKGLSHSGNAENKAHYKGDVLTVVHLAAIMGCKKTPDLIPLCHPLQLSHISVQLFPQCSPQPKPGCLQCDTQNQTGVVEKPSQITRHDNLPSYRIVCEATVSCDGKTGVEMEALTAVSVGLLTVWDMLKAVAGKEMVIGDIFVLRKAGGKSGDFIRDH